MPVDTPTAAEFVPLGESRPEASELTGRQACSCTPDREGAIRSPKTTISPVRGRAITASAPSIHAGSATPAPSQPLVFFRLDIRHLLCVRTPPGRRGCAAGFLACRGSVLLPISTTERPHELGLTEFGPSYCSGDAPTADDIRAGSGAPRNRINRESRETLEEPVPTTRTEDSLRSAGAADDAEHVLAVGVQLRPADSRDGKQRRRCPSACARRWRAGWHRRTPRRPGPRPRWIGPSASCAARRPGPDRPLTGSRAQRPTFTCAGASSRAPQIRHRPGAPCRPGVAESGAMPVRNRLRRRVRRPPCGPGQRPGQRQPGPGPGDADVEQPAFLLDLLGCLGVLDGQRPVGQPDQEDRVPLQPLGGVQRGKRHALDGRARAGPRRAGRARRPACRASRRGRRRRAPRRP